MLFDWSRKLAPPSQPIRCKLKPIAPWSLAFSRATGRLHAFTSSCHWLPLIISFTLIGRCDYFGFGFRHSIEKRSKHRLGLITGRCPTLTDYREVRKGLDVKSDSPLMKSYTFPLDKLLHRVRIPGRLRNFDGDSNKVNSRSFKLHRDYPSSLNLWIVRKLSWRWIIRDGIHVKETKENSLTCDHVPCAEVGKKCTKKCDAHTCLVVGGC